MKADFDEIVDDINHEIASFNDIENPVTPLRKKTSKIFYNESESVCCWIESFVIAASRVDEFPSWFEKLEIDKADLHREPLVCFYPLMSMMLAACDVRYQYTPYIEAFIQVSHQLGFFKPDFYWSDDTNEKPTECELNFKALFCRLVYELKTYCESSAFTRAIRIQRNQVLRRQIAVMRWEKKLFACRSRYLMLHLTLGYQTRYRDAVTPEIVHDHLGRLFHNSFMNESLSGILDYALRIEDGPEVGLHVHLIIAYDGQSQRDQAISKYVCQYWINTITNGIGTADADNFYKKSINARGLDDATGQINHFDIGKREGLLIALNYLCKGEQALRKRAHKKVRTFSLSRSGEKRVSGRPRKVLTSTI